LGTLSEKEILAQVKRICNNPEFKSKSLLCRFLRFVVNETLVGHGDQLKGYIIGVEVLGKDTDFDPEHDSLVRIHAGRLRRLLKMYYLEDGKDDPVVIEIPKGGYQPQFKLRNPEGLTNKTTMAEASGEKSSPRIEPSVAVIPFKNLTGDPEKDYFAHGFSEEISIELTKYENLRIINCWHRPDPKFENDRDLIGRYGARFLIDGSVQLNGERIKVLVKLIDASTGMQIWAERYNRDLSLENLIDIEEDISEEIAKILGSEIGIVFRQLAEEAIRLKPGRLDVFNAMLHFYYFEAHQSQELAVKSCYILEQALKKDPDSGEINAMLAAIYGNAYALDLPNNAGTHEKMSDLAEKAMAMDPDNQFIRIIHVFKCFLQNDWNCFFNEVNQCLAMNIYSPMRLGILGFYLALSGEWDQGKTILNKAMNKNIGYPLYLYGATSLYHYRKAEFIKALEEANKYDIPGLFWGPMLRAACLGQLNRKKEAKRQIINLKQLKPDFEDKAPYLISRFVKEDDLVENVLEGLRKAGVKISINPAAF